MDTLTKTPIFTEVSNQYEVIGGGVMPTIPTQIGDWWVMPAQEYKGKIPKEANEKLFSLINSGVKIKGILIADDLKKVEPKIQKEQGKVTTKRSAGPLLGGLGTGLLYIMAAALTFNPMLVAVLEDGRWICLHAWWD